MTPSASNDPEELLEHADFLRALARGLLGDAARADDVVQDAYLAALERPPVRLDARGSLRSWLGTLVRNLSLNVRRGERRRAGREHAVARGEPTPSHEEVADRLELQRSVLTDVLALREPYRATIYARYYEGRSPSEIAEREGIPVKTVKTRLSRALAMLRERLDARADGDRAAWLSALAPLAFARNGAAAAAGGVPLTTGALAGGLAMKKIGLVAAAVVVLVGGWGVWRAVDSEPAGASSPAALRSDLASLEGSDGPARAEPAPIVTAGAADRRPVEPAPAAAEPPAGPYGSLTVRVRWAEDGAPAAGVGLEVRASGDPMVERRIATPTTDEHGHVHLARLHEGDVRVSATRGGRARGTVFRGCEMEVDLTIPRGIAVEGVVEDEAGRPVPFAGIWLSRMPQTWLGGRLETRADAQGRFRLRAVGAELGIAARAAGYAPSPIEELGERRATGRVRLVLRLTQEGCDLEGRVVRPDGAPVEGARVAVGPPLGPPAILADGTVAQTPSPLVVTTDAEGRFRAEGNRAGVVPLAVLAEGFPVWLGATEVAAGERGEVRVELAPGVSVEGTLRDEANEPVWGAGVTLAYVGRSASEGSPFPLPATRTDAQGRYRLDWVPAVRLTIRASLARGRTQRAKGRIEGSPGETVTWDATLTEGATLTGVVVDGAGEPLGQMLVEAKPARSGEARGTVTGADGRFVLTNVVDTPHLVEVRDFGAWTEHPLVTLSGVRPDGNPIEVVVEREVADAHVVGRFVDTGRRVAEDARVTVILEARDGSSRAASPDAEGRFRVGPVAAGEHRLRVFAKSALVVAGGWFELAERQELDVGEIFTEVAGELALEVTWPPGVDPARASVVVSDLERGFGRMLVRDGDALRAEGLEPGSYALHISCSGVTSRQRTVEVRPGETTRAKIELEPGADVRIDVVAPDDAAPWVLARVTLRGRDGEVFVEQDAPYNSAFPGVFVACGLPVGAYVLVVTTDSGLEVRGELEIASLEPLPDPLRFALR